MAEVVGLARRFCGTPQIPGAEMARDETVQPGQAPRDPIGFAGRSGHGVSHVDIFARAAWLSFAGVLGADCYASLHCLHRRGYTVNRNDSFHLQPKLFDLSSQV